jgi:hypothetical protein
MRGDDAAAQSSERLMREAILAEPYLHFDDSTVQVLR